MLGRGRGLRALMIQHFIFEQPRAREVGLTPAALMSFLATLRDVERWVSDQVGRRVRFRGIEVGFEDAADTVSLMAARYYLDRPTQWDLVLNVGSEDFVMSNVLAHAQSYALHETLHVVFDGEFLKRGLTDPAELLARLFADHLSHRDLTGLSLSHDCSDLITSENAKRVWEDGFRELIVNVLAYRLESAVGALDMTKYSPSRGLGDEGLGQFRQFLEQFRQQYLSDWTNDPEERRREVSDGMVETARDVVIARISGHGEAADAYHRQMIAILDELAQGPYAEDARLQRARYERWVAAMEDLAGRLYW
ncbi:MAG: hypothetical protein HYZ91_00485, partial [Candidatus Omnitrophica bacterium]|nr:hypothetical protein [Candidatus Omnitrophota bacterium]